MLEAWPRSRRSILIQGEELSVDDTCVVIIQSLEDQVCEVSTEPVVVTSTATEPVVVSSSREVTSTEPPVVALSTFVITVVAVLFIAVLATVAVVIMMIILCYFRHKMIQDLK